MKTFIFSMVILLSSFSTFANGVDSMKKALDAVAPLLDSNEQVVIARKTWAIHESGPDWFIYVYQSQKGNSIITLTKDLKFIQRVSCPQDNAPSICEL